MISSLASAAAQDAHVDDEGFDHLPESFRRAYERHVDFVWRNLRRLGVPDGDLEDAVQETFVVAYRRRDTYRTGASPRGWLYGIVRRIASRFRRGAMRRGRLHLAIAGAPEAANDLTQTIEQRDAWRIVEQFVVGLPDDKRDVFVLAELEGMTGTEIATLLQLNPNTVGSRLRAGRSAFARYLETMSARERGARLRLEHGAVLDAGRRAPGPDRERRASVGGALALQIGSTSSGGWWTTFAGLRAFLLTIGIGTAGVVATAASLPDDDATSVSSASEEQEPLRAEASQQTRREPPARVDQTRAVASPEAPTPTHAATPRPPRASTPRAREAAKHVETAPQPATPSEDELLAEAKLLKQIKHSLRIGAHHEALRLADTHAQAFPNGKLAVEASALRILALCGLDRDADARRTAAALARDVPHHPTARVATEGCPTNTSTSSAAPGEGGSI
jgi:RNA polymerase sigma factor (sigma-70 family)